MGRGVAGRWDVFILHLGLRWTCMSRIHVYPIFQSSDRRREAGRTHLGGEYSTEWYIQSCHSVAKSFIDIQFTEKKKAETRKQKRKQKPRTKPVYLIKASLIQYFPCEAFCLIIIRILILLLYNRNMIISTLTILDTSRHPWNLEQASSISKQKAERYPNAQREAKYQPNHRRYSTLK